jgi:HK97 family phage major capsid protein
MLGLARNVESESNPYRVPKLSSHGSAAWTAEAAAYNESDETFDETLVTVHKATRLVKVSEELLDDNAVELDSYLAEEFGRSIGALVNTALTVGSGSGEPWGFVPQVGAGTTFTFPTGSVTDYTADGIIDVFYKLKPQYRPRATWVMSDAAAQVVRKLKDLNDRYLWQDGLAAGEPATLLGRPVVLNPDMAVPAANAKSLAFGDFSFYFAVRRPSISLMRLNERYRDSGLIGFIANVRVGADLVQPEAIALGQNAAS